MSSWLSGNLSGSLSSLSNFTGQISSFTREMLTEGTEEVSDPSAELQVAQARINDLEAHILTQKSEYERLKQNNDELHVRLEASELQISNISKEYRAQLHNKEQELIKLRELSRFHEEHGQSFGRRERHDSTDSIEDSMETKRLRSEIKKLQAECEHWKSIANGLGNQDNLHKEIDQYQHELTALQSSYSQKISNLNKKHKQELQNWQDEKQEYLQRIEELEERLLEDNSSSNSHGGQNDENTNSVLSLKKQLVFAEKSIAELKGQVESQEEQVNALKGELQEKQQAIVAAQENLDYMQAKFQTATETHNQAMGACESKLNESIQQVEQLQTQLDDQSKELSVSRSDSEGLQKLQEEFNSVAAENAELNKQLNHSQSEERRLHRSVEEVKCELEQLTCSTMDLMEELQISQGLQQEQKIELESLKNVKYIKGDAKQEMEKLRSALAALWERHLSLVQLYQQVRHELHNSNARLLAMFQTRHLSTSAVHEDLRELQHRLVERGDAKLEQVVKEKEAMMGRSAELRVTVEELEGAVMDLQSDNEQVAQETKYCVTEMARQPGVDEEEASDIVGALHAEKAVLESTIVGLEHKVQDLQELVNSLQSQKGWSINNENNDRQTSRSGSAESLTESTPHECELSIDMGDLGSQMSEPSLEPVLRQDNEVALEGGVFPNTDNTLGEELAYSELQQQLQDYQQQVEEFELAQNDWEGEKEALEGLVLSLRRQVKELQEVSANLGKNNSSSEEEITKLRGENVKILTENKQLLEAWKQIEEDFVSLDISSPHVAKDTELDGVRLQELREDLNRWSLNKSSAPVNDTISDSSQTDQSFELYLTKFEEFEKENSLLRVQTERLIQEIEEKTSKVTDLQSELEAKSVDVKSISDEKRDLMIMINQRDERICELEESFNNHLLDLTSSKDNEISLLQTEQEDVVKLLEENRQECSLLKNKNNELLDLMGQHQQAQQELNEKYTSLEVLLAEKEEHLETLNKEKENLVTKVQHNEKLNESLAAENNSMLMEKEVLQSMIEEYQEKVKGQENQAAENLNSKKEIERLNQLLKNSEERFKELDTKQIVLCEEKRNLELERQQSIANLDNFTSEIEMLNEEKNKLIDAVQKHALTCNELEQKLNESIIEKDELNKQLGVKDLQVDKLELDLREKGADIDLLKLDMAKLSKSLKEKEQLIHTQVVNASDPAQSSDEALYRQAQLLRLLEEKDQEIAALKQKDASLIELVSRTDQSTHRAQEEYENKLQLLKEERDKLLDDLSMRDEELLTVEDKLEAMREKMHSKDQASHLLHTEHTRLLALNESQANEMGKLRERNASLQKLVEEYNRGKNAELQQLQEGNNQLRRQIGALQVEHETLTTLVHEKDKQIATLAQLASSDSPVPSPQGVEPHVKRLREERDVLLRERDSAFREKEIKEREISQLQEQGHSLRQTLEKKCNLADKLLAENEKLSGQYSSLQSELNSLSQDKSNLTRSDNRVKELEEQLTALTSVIESKDKQLKQALENNRNEKSSIMVELENLKSERDEILEQKYIETGELKNKIVQLANSLTDSDPREHENVGDIDKNFQALLHTVRNQRNSALRERDNEIQSLREQLSNVTLLNKAPEAQRSELEEVLRDKEELHRLLLQARDEKEDLLRDKESVVADLQDQIVSLSRVVSEKERASHQDLQRVTQERDRIINELDQAQRDREQMNTVNSQRQAEVSRLQAELHEIKGVLTQERDSISSVQRELDQYKMALQEKERITKDMMVEREQLQRAQEQLQHRGQQLQEELSAATSGQKIAETKRTQELDRLRNHLVQVEESYTREALEAEEREKDLRMKLARAEEQLLSSSHSMLDRDRQASVQIENLQEQLQAIAAQRDRAVMDLASVQEQAHQYQTSLSNLQLVLEQFQREREDQLRAFQEQAQKEIGKAWAQVKDLQTRENQLKSQLEVAARITQEVVDMRGQLKLKDEELLKHREEVNRLEEELRVSQERIKSLNSMSDSKVEKSLVKNMLMGYFNTPENKRADVVHVIGGLLGFTHEELEKVGTGSSAPTGSWISSIMPFGHAAPKTPTRTTASAHKSFSELFVSFLESESEVPRSSGEASGRVSNPLLSGMTPQQSTAGHVPGGHPIATSTPIGTPARPSNVPTLPPSAIPRPLMTAATGEVLMGTRASSSSGATGNPLLVGSLTPVQELPALSSSSSLQALLEGRK